MCCRSSAGTRSAAETRWVTEKWKTRRGKLFLVPGDCPVGYRLPLSSLQHIPPTSLSLHRAARPAARRAAPCPSPRNCCADKQQPIRAQAGIVHRRSDEPAGPHRAGNRRDRRRGAHRPHGRARDGRLCVFMPPVETLEDYLELVAAAEAAAQSDRPAGPYRGLCAAARSAPQRHPRRARPRRHRGQHPSGLELGRLRRDHHRDLRGSAAVAGSAPTSS